MQKCKLLFKRKTKNAWGIVSIKGPVPGKRTAAFVAAILMERTVELISENLQTLKWNYHKNNNELWIQNLKPTFRLHIFLLSHNNNNNNTKVKFSLERDMKAQKGNRGIVLLFLQIRH